MNLSDTELEIIAKAIDKQPEFRKLWNKNMRGQLLDKDLLKEADYTLHPEKYMGVKEKDGKTMITLRTVMTFVGSHISAWKNIDSRTTRTTSGDVLVENTYKTPSGFIVKLSTMNDNPKSLSLNLEDEDFVPYTSEDGTVVKTLSDMYAYSRRVLGEKGEITPPRKPITKATGSITETSDGLYNPWSAVTDTLRSSTGLSTTTLDMIKQYMTEPVHSSGGQTKKSSTKKKPRKRKR